MTVSAYGIAERFIGQTEVKGTKSNPLILGMLQLADRWPTDDSVPWCSAFVFWVAWLLDLPRPERDVLAARSWLGVGQSVSLENAIVGFDIVVLQRGKSPTAGHVGFYAGHTADKVILLGGNQGDAINIQKFDRLDVLGVRRLA